jgi:signal peptidase
VATTGHDLTAVLRWVRRGLDLALIVLVVIGLTTVALARIVPATGRTSLIVTGGSMEPAISLGSVAIVEPVDPGTLQPGDIVSMKAPGAVAVVTHRIVRIVDRADGAWLETRGDANVAADPVLVPSSAVIGRVQAAIPFAGRVMQLLSRPGGVLVLFGIAGLLLLAIWWLESHERRASRRNRGARVPKPVAPGIG